jgi:predicted ATPase
MANRMKQSSLLALDNLEHLLVPQGRDTVDSEVVGLIVEILHRLPNFKILATSRDQLNLQGEWMYELYALPAE